MKKKFKTTLLIIFILFGAKSYTQTIITARVLDDETKKPIKEATVQVVAKNISTKTNSLGYFQIAVDSSDSLKVTNTYYHSLTFLWPNTSNFQILFKRIQAKINNDDWERFNYFLASNITYPSKATSNSKHGCVYVSFKIDSMGIIQEIKLLSDVGGGCGKEVVRVLSEMPNNITLDKKNILYILPVVFKLGHDDKFKYEPIINLPDGEILTEMVVTAIGI